MSTAQTPKQPIPPPLRGSEPGTFAEQTVTTRLPKIVQQVLDTNDFPSEIAARLEALKAELPYAPIRPLQDRSAPDIPAWDEYLAGQVGKPWREAPMFLAETYFFRRILEATGYFQPGEWQGVDPYRPEKEQSLKSSQESLREIAAEANEWLERPQAEDEALDRLLLAAVWGNQADLSLWPVGSEAQPGHSNVQEQRDHLLVSHIPQVIDRLLGSPEAVPRVDILVDNVGMDLVADLCLADYLLIRRLALQVCLQLKVYPTFVSDATESDIHDTVRSLTQNPDAEVRFLGRRLKSHLFAGRLTLTAPWFWTSPLPTWEMPDDLRQTLSQAVLIISKGDANYRRLIGDSHWPRTTPLADVLRYVPAPLLVLRVIKSQVAVGLDAGQIAALDLDAPDWMTSGNWGLAQFYAP